jgi:hypothetical protein
MSAWNGRLHDATLERIERLERVVLARYARREVVRYRCAVVVIVKHGRDRLDAAFRVLLRVVADHAHVETLARLEQKLTAHARVLIVGDVARGSDVVDVTIPLGQRIREPVGKPIVADRPRGRRAHSRRL